MAMWQRSPGAPHRLTPAPLPVTQAHILLSSACPTVIHLPHARLVRSGPTASLAPWPARSSPPSALLPLQHRRSCTSALTLRRQRLTPLPPLRGREGLAYPVRVFFNTTPGCRDHHPDERCRPVWTNRPPPSGEDWCVYPAGTVSSVSCSWRVAHTHTVFPTSCEPFFCTNIMSPVYGGKHSWLQLRL